MQGPLEDDFNRISTRSSDKDLCEIMQGPLRGFHQDLCIPQDHQQGPGAAVAELRRFRYKNPPRASQLSYKHLQYMTSAIHARAFYRRSHQDFHNFLTRTYTRSRKDLLERVSPGSSQDLLIRTCTMHKIMHGPSADRISPGSSQHLLTRTSTIPRPRSSYIMDLQECTTTLLQDRHTRDQDRDKCFARACAIEVHIDISEGTALARIYCTWTSQKLLRECTMKMPQTKTFTTLWRKLCASLRCRTHGSRTMALLRENLQQKCAAQRTYPDLTPAFTLTVRTLSVDTQEQSPDRTGHISVEALIINHGGVSLSPSLSLVSLPQGVQQTNEAKGK